jgi:hypothetical protein
MVGGMKYTSTARSLESAKKFAASLNGHRIVGSPLRFIAVVIHAETTGYHVVSLGFAESNGFAIIR